MPFFDRYWQLRWLGAGVAVVAAVLVPLWYLQVAAAWDRVQGWGMQPDDFFAAGTAVAFLGVAFFLGWSTRRARARLEWRIKRISSNHSTRHQAPPDRVSVHGAAEEPVTIVLHLSQSYRVTGWIGVLWFILFALGSSLVFILVGLVVTTPGSPSWRGETAPVFVFVILVPAMLFALWSFGAVASYAWMSSSRYELDEFGITWIRSSGRGVTIHWQEAHLLEAVTSYRLEYTRFKRQVSYLLYGDSIVIRITPKPGMYYDVRHLLELIKEHSGLTPQQFG